MANYQQVLLEALTAHGNAQQSVRGPWSAKRVSDAVEGFAEPFATLAAVIAKRRSGDRNDNALLDALRAIEAQHRVLVSAVERAQADDDLTVHGVVVNQAAARALAEKQKEADQRFLAKVDELLDIVRGDAGASG